MNSFQNIRGTFNILWRAKDGKSKEYRNLIFLFPLSFTKTIDGKGSYFCFSVCLCFTSEVIQVFICLFGYSHFFYKLHTHTHTHTLCPYIRFFVFLIDL